MKNKCPFEILEYNPNIFRIKHPKIIGYIYGRPVWNTAKMSEQEWLLVRMNEEYGVRG